MTYNTETTLLSPWRRLRDFIAESLSDNEADFTVGPIGRSLGLLAVPMMLEMAMEAVFAVVDIAFVSRLGTNAVAAVGITEALITVLYALAIGLGMGVTAMVSRRIGEKDANAAAQVTGQAIWIGVAISMLIGVLGVRYAADLLALMGADDAVIREGRGFTAILLGGNASILFLFLLNAAFRGAGDAPVALRALTLANGLNILLDPCLIFGLGPFPEMGVTGAAVATTTGRGIGVLYLLYYLFSAGGRLNFQLRHLRIVPAIISRMINISIGGIGQFLVATASWIAMMRIVAVFGSAPIAAFTIALRMIEFAFLPAWGLGNAAATLVGQNLGAGKAERAEKVAWQATRYNALFMSVLGLASFAFAPYIVELFSSDPEILAYGTSCLRILGLGYPLYAIGMIIIQALNGAGDTATPTVLNFICFWLVQIPIAYSLAVIAGIGPSGVFWGIIISESLLSVVAVQVFRRGKWKLQQV
ncbi:MAG: MATE family efflux transporter [Gammaproteobacteria bacterium]|nr:MATE family efflux transporter [Gammaproteobacteria bacterium]